MVVLREEIRLLKSEPHTTRIVKPCRGRERRVNVHGNIITSIHDYCIDHRQYTLQGSIWFVDKAHRCIRYTCAYEPRPAQDMQWNNFQFLFGTVIFAHIYSSSSLLSLSPYHSLSVSCCWAVLLRAGRGMAKIWLRSVSISNWKLG